MYITIKYVDVLVVWLQIVYILNKPPINTIFIPLLESLKFHLF